MNGGTLNRMRSTPEGVNETSLGGLRRPEYTGERRCWPCTIVNVFLLLIATVFVWVVSPSAALGLLAIGTGAIWLRGYLVPYTPKFAPALLAALPGPFEKARPVEASTIDAGEALDGDAVVGALLDAGVLVVGESPDAEAADDELLLEDSFRDRWRAEIRSLRGESLDELAAATLDSSPGAVDVEVHERSDGTWIVLHDGSGRLSGETWLSHQVAIAEAAAVRVLREFLPDAGDVLYATAARPLRTFMWECPICDGDVIETTTRSCCGSGPDPMASPARPVLACAECDRRIYTFEALK